MTTTIQSTPHRSQVTDTAVRRFSAATVTTAGATTFIGFVAVLHILKTELDPTYRMVSEYEIGRFGPIMSVAFVALAISCIAAHRAIRPFAVDRSGRLGRFFLIVTAVGLVIAALATTDPITATKDQLTTRGNIHGLGALLGIPAFIVAACLLTRSLRRNPTINASTLAIARRAVIGSLVLFVGSMAVMFRGEFGPDVRIGIQNRLLVLTYAIYLFAVARVTRRAH